MSTRIIRAGRIDDAIGSEISYVDHPANEQSKIVGVTIAKRDASAADLNPDALAAIGVRAEEAGPIAKMMGWLFRKRDKGGFAKAAPRKIRKSLWDVGDLARTVLTLDAMAQSASAERDYEGDNSELPERLAALRDEAGSILIAMVEEEVGELRNGGSNGADKMASAEEIAKNILSRAALEKRGAKISAANQQHLANIKKCMNKAADCFGKAAANHPEDDDIATGMAHHAMAANHLAKLDVGDGVDDDSKPAPANSKFADVDDLRKSPAADLARQVASMRAELDRKQGDAIEKSHQLEIENVRLTTQLETLGNLPIRPKAFIGTPVDKSAHAAEIARAASGREAAPDINNIKVSDPDGFRKSLSAVRANPQPLRTLQADVGAAA